MSRLPLAAAILALSSCGGPDAALNPHISTPAWASQTITDLPLTEVATAAVRPVVHISASRRAEEQRGRGAPFGFPAPQPGGGVGSGVIVDAQGRILTNNHVVEGADTLVVTLDDGRQFDARVRGTDPATDLAVLEIDGRVPADLPFARIGDSERLKLGEVVLAIGNPFGLQGTVTMGIVSAIGRADIGLASYEDFIQTDAAVNPGNSGGALVNLRGEVVGINTAIESMSGGNQGIAFAIPSNMAREVMSRLITDGRVVRGYLGVGIQDVEPGAAPLLGLGGDTRGALVNHVEPGTPSAAAGLRAGDVIVAVDGEPVRNAAHLRRVVSMKGAAVDVKIGLVRGGAPAEVKARLTALPGEELPAAPPPPHLGADALRGMRLGSAPGGGVQILDVDPGSEAWRRGIRQGDVIQSVNQVEVSGLNDLKSALSSPQGALLLVRRAGAPRFVYLPPGR